MEELLKLINEYEKDFAEKFGCGVGQARTYHYDKEDECIRNQKGEEYNFDSLNNLKDLIKRLVDNDKIDLGKLIMIKDEEQKAIIDIDNSRENTLLMLLSIQDNPIEFLISILK